ncbi:hypothetical protein FHW88_005610 [Mucilaginibacter sp. SG538B]|nr:hypothetical protein [Mucilaginibacter sp. SG538B]
MAAKRLVASFVILQKANNGDNRNIVFPSLRKLP